MMMTQFRSFLQSLRKLQKILDKVNRCSDDTGLTMNITKSKFMIVSRTPDLDPIISVDGKNLEAVGQYKYLDPWVNEP